MMFVVFLKMYIMYCVSTSRPLHISMNDLNQLPTIIIIFKLRYHSLITKIQSYVSPKLGNVQLAFRLVEFVVEDNIRKPYAHY